MEVVCFFFQMFLGIIIESSSLCVGFFAPKQWDFCQYDGGGAKHINCKVQTFAYVCSPNYFANISSINFSFCRTFINSGKKLLLLGQNLNGIPKDIACVHQTDAELRERGVYGIGGWLAVSCSAFLTVDMFMYSGWTNVGRWVEIKLSWLSRSYTKTNCFFFTHDWYHILLYLNVLFVSCSILRKPQWAGHSEGSLLTPGYFRPPPSKLSPAGFAQDTVDPPKLLLSVIWQ